MYKFPERLNELMIEFNINQLRLSKETKIPQPTIVRWLADKHRPTVDCLITLATYFKCSIDYLVGMVD